ncbi:V-type ATP synthase subunit D [Acidaminobacterium chupaoyuni]
MPNIAPTKGNLSRIRRSLSLAKMGYELMDRKRNILIREMMQLIDRAKDLQAQIDGTFTRAYAALQEANIQMGTCQDISLATPVDDTLSLGYRSVMGVEIPIVTGSDFEAKLTYGFYGTESSLDRTLAEFYRAKKLCAALAEVETGVYRLANSIKKAQKRANALQNIIIPQYTATIAYIVGVLEEREREEFSRLKVIKARKTEE